MDTFRELDDFAHDACVSGVCISVLCIVAIAGCRSDPRQDRRMEDASASRQATEERAEATAGDGVAESPSPEGQRRSASAFAR